MEECPHDFFESVKETSAEEKTKAGTVNAADLYKEATRLHMAAGLGMKFVLNRNTISSWELAKPFNRDDGNWKVLISANFAF